MHELFSHLAIVDTRTVTSTADSGADTLRQAITDLEDGDTVDQDVINIQFNSIEIQAAGANLNDSGDTF